MDLGELARSCRWSYLKLEKEATQLNPCLSPLLSSQHQSDLDMQNKPRPNQAESTERIKMGMNWASVLWAKYFPPCAVHKLFSEYSSVVGL